MNLVQLVRSRRVEERYSLNQYAKDVSSFAFGGQSYPLTQTYGAGNEQNTERAESPFAHWVGSAYKANGVVFACQVARLLLFSEARFQFQRLSAGRPGEFFGTQALSVLENPWPNGSTGELLARMIQDVDLSGNAFIRRTSPLADPRLERLRPDWVSIVLGTNSDLLNAEVIGYIYEPGGPGQGKPIPLSRDEVAHWSPIPDPIATYRGMSWLTPVIREIRGDAAMTAHKQAFLDHAATPNMVVRFDPEVSTTALETFRALFNAEHQGYGNAYKTLFLGGGADVTPVGHSFEQMDFKNIQGAGETRIAAAAGVPPVIVGLSEGLAAATYSNYAQARRRYADMTIRPLWRSCCAALAGLLSVPGGSRLWYDDRDIPALQEDEKDAAEIEHVKASTIGMLVREGFDPKTVLAAVNAQDMSLLVHTGLVSVQLQPPGTPPAAALPSTNGNTPAQEVSA